MKLRILILGLFTIYFILSIVQIVFACQPIVQLVMVFSGTAFFTRSIIGLIIGILIKGIAFAIFEKTISKIRAFKLMIVANIGSSISGLFLGLAFAVPMMLPLTIVIIYGFVSKPSERLEKLKLERFPKISARMLAIFLTLSSLLTIILFALAMEHLQIGQISIPYWLLKISYVTLGIMVSIIISGLIEEYIINSFVNKSNNSRHFFPAVFRSNFITSFILIGYIAVKTIPDRLNSYDKLIYGFILKMITFLYFY